MMQRAGVTALFVFGLACRGSTPAPVADPPRVEVPTPAPPPVSLWPATLAEAVRAFDAGRHEDADRILREHSTRMAGTAEGAESDFWRALFKADPANPGPSTRERMALFDAYLVAGATAPRYVEAQIFRRLLESLDSTRTAVIALRTLAETRDKARDDEVRRLSEDLDRTLAELERIRRRLTPKPPEGATK